ncbi:MAG: substrate-binding domain-containing protein [Gemmataceae bacterium]
MSSAKQPENRLKEERQRRGWSQADLAERAGISRAAVSAIENARLLPSVAAALSLAHALESSVELLFAKPKPPVGCSDWAWTPSREPCRYWLAQVRDRLLRYPVEMVSPLAHDGCLVDGRFIEHPHALPDRTLVLASCDPAAGLLAGPLWQQFGIRLLVLSRSSSQSLKLLGDGLVHIAGLHFATAERLDSNAAAVVASLGNGYSLLRLARWQEGIALGRALGLRSVSSALKSRLRWVGREPGSAARQCLDELLPARCKLRRFARDHFGVAEAVRSGWADAGVCVRYVSAQADLDFLPVRDEFYDVCFPASETQDPRIQSVIQLVRERSFRQVMNELPGYQMCTADMQVLLGNAESQEIRLGRMESGPSVEV